MYNSPVLVEEVLEKEINDPMNVNVTTWDKNLRSSSSAFLGFSRRLVESKLIKNTTQTGAAVLSYAKMFNSQIRKSLQESDDKP